MSVPIIAFFSAKRGVGTTSIVYHLAWMLSDLGVKVLAVDLDPQANLTSAFVGGGMPNFSPYLAPEVPEPIMVDSNLALLPGGLKLSDFEEELARQWQRSMDGDEQAFRVLSEPWRKMTAVAAHDGLQLVLVDLGPNLSAINRAGLMAADHIILPLAPDVFSVVGLEILGAALGKWRASWQACRPSNNVDLPSGNMTPLGYVLRQPGVRLRAEVGWISWIAERYRKHILNIPPSSDVSIRTDPNQLAILRSYTGLLDMAQEAHKPMFHLKPADGALGAFLQSAEDARRDFEALAKAIVAKANLPITFDR